MEVQKHKSPGFVAAFFFWGGGGRGVARHSSREMMNVYNCHCTKIHYELEQLY